MSRRPKCNPSTHPTPSNAFRRRFLRRFDARDEPVTGLEADMAGPWSVVPLPGEGFGLFRAGEHPSRGYRPTAVFPDRSLALLAAAVLPGTGRDPLLSLDGHPDPGSGRYALRLDDGTVVGHTEQFEEALGRRSECRPQPGPLTAVAGVSPRRGRAHRRGALRRHPR